MVKSEIEKLWICCHLLYPNTAQAKDIFQTILEKTDIKNYHYLKSLRIIFEIFKKRPIVRSSTQFFEFSQIRLKGWEEIQKKCNRIEAFLLLNVIVHKIPYHLIAKQLRMEESKIVYLAKQAIKKIIYLPKTRIEFSKTLNFKKHNQLINSKLYIIEKIIENALLGEPYSKKVELSTENVFEKQALDFESKILDFIKEFENLPISIELDIALKALNEKQHLSNKVVNNARFYRNYLFVIGLAAGTALLLITRPFILDKFQKKLKKDFVTLSNLKNPPLSIAKESSNSIESEAIKPEILQLNLFNQPTTQGLDVAINNVDSRKMDNVKKDISSANLKISDENKIISQNKQDMKLSTTSSTTQIAQIQKADDSKNKENQNIRKSIAELESIQKAESLNTKEVNNGVYRGELSVVDFDQVSLDIKNFLIEKGSKKAGEVELGWIKNKTTSYFHFVFPKIEENNIILFLKNYETFKFKFEPHPRKLQQGQRRFILEVHKVEE